MKKGRRECERPYRNIDIQVIEFTSELSILCRLVPIRDGGYDMKNLSLRMKLTVGFGVILLILATLGIISYWTIGNLVETASETESRMTKKTLAYSLESGIEKQTTGVRSFPDGRQRRLAEAR